MYPKIHKLSFKIIFFITFIIIIEYYNKSEFFQKLTALSNNNDNYKIQKLKVIKSSEKCRTTLYFSSNYSELIDQKKIKIINLKDQNYFITFYKGDHVYDQHLKLLERHGLIQCFEKNSNINLFISSLYKSNSFKNKRTIYQINQYQKVYQYLNAPYIFRKSSLYKFYISMKKLFFEDYDYMPLTYNYPEQKNEIHDKFKNYKFDLNDLWLVKPVNNYGGRNISFFYSLENIKLKKFIITQYIKKVNLIKGKKYDLRLYILITGLKPLRIYFYKEGLVRIASEIFSLNKSSINNKFIHLTNLCVNSLNKRFIRPNGSSDENSNQWNLKIYRNFLKKNNIEWKNIRKKIKDIIIKSIISVYRNLTEVNEKLKVEDQSFYEVLGYDILIDNKFNPKLLEINYTPNMMFSNKLDREIKSNLFVDTLNLVGITPFSKIKKQLHNGLNSKYDKGINNNINNALCELKRPKGNYELIFPTNKTINHYKKFFIYNTEENKKFWNILFFHNKY